MRFVQGPIPEDPAFDPESEGWRAIREPDPVWMQLFALPVLAVTALVLYLVLSRGLEITPGQLMGWLPVSFLVVIPLHELIHAFANPAFGLTPSTYVGMWPERLLFYAHYEGELTRGHFLWILAAPTLFLTILPLALCVARGWSSLPLVALAVANGLSAAGDLFGIILVFWQIPRGVLVRNKGWRSYWKPRP